MLVSDRAQILQDFMHLGQLLVVLVLRFGIAVFVRSRKQGVIAEVGVFEQGIHRIQPEARDAPLIPPSGHFEHCFLDRRIAPVQIGLLGIEIMVVVLVGLRIQRVLLSLFLSPAAQFTISPWKCAAKLRDKAVLPLPVGPSTTTSSGSQPTSAGTPGNVVPVTREGDDHDQRGDDQKAGGFQGVDMRARMMGRARLARWREDRHSDIVSPVMDRKKATVQAVLNYGGVAMPLPQTNQAGRIVRFGIFEVDLAAGELRKGGARVRLQEQPFQVLAYLLQHPGEIVTREELRQKLWPADTFVDFDHSLNTAVNKVREALGDSASSPRYLETLARRGYRFLAPVESAHSGPKDAGTEPLVTQLNGSPLHPELDIPLPRRSLTRALFGLIQIMYLVFYLVALFRLGEIDRVTNSFLPGWAATGILVAVITTAAGEFQRAGYLFPASPSVYP